MKRRIDIEEDFLCLVTGILLAVIFLALVMGDGSIGLFDLF